MGVKSLYIIAGPNGAGKTTASFTILPGLLRCKNFVNADEIARGISPFSPESVAVQAGRIMLHRIDELILQGVDFAIETTLATRSYVNLIKRAKKSGYKIFMLFFYLENPNQAILRVRQRVSEGGHDIPNEVIIRRYNLGIRNLIDLYIPICDNVTIYNNTNSPSNLIARKNGVLEVLDNCMWNQIINNK